MKIKIVLILALAVFMTGCATSTPKQEEGWSSAQQKEFLDILDEDKYASICEQQAFYESVKKQPTAPLLDKLLVAYTNNLANGCIDTAAFNKAQQQRKAKRIETNYDLYLQEVKPKTILAQIRAGQSIEKILSPYIPTTEQFALLIEKYNALKDKSSTDPKQLEKIRLNIERTKLMRADLGEDYALVNIPDFKVRLKKENQTMLQFGVIVGQKHLQTPIFAEEMQYITLNPQWSVPDSIARHEIIPAVLKDPSYLKRNNMVVRSDYNLDSAPLDPASIDLAQYKGGKGHVPFKFIERPSKGNVLGRIKFIFPNRHSVYMHDTQTKPLFKRKVRTFSHGCVRLEKPNDLLKYIASNYTSKTSQEIIGAYDSLKTHHVGLKKRLMVHTAYLTSYVDESGKLLMFDDVYGYDGVQKLRF